MHGVSLLLVIYTLQQTGHSREFTEAGGTPDEANGLDAAEPLNSSSSSADRTKVSSKLTAAGACIPQPIPEARVFGFRYIA